MLYIEVPKGMVFQRRTVFQKHLNAYQEHDFLIDPRNHRNPIDLQHLVKEALRHKTRYEASSAKEIIIHFHLPNKPEHHFLQYAPHRNGALASLEEPKMIRGNMLTSSHYHGTWFTQIPLSADRLARVEEKRDEQRHNRRHDGDSPTPS